MNKGLEKAIRTPDAIRAQWEAKISVSNSKTGIPSFNTLAGTGIYNGCTPRTERALNAFTAAGIDLNDLPVATCNCDCPGCYAKKLTRYTAVFISYVKNTWIARNAPEKIKNAVNGFIKAKQPDKFRIHDSGDFFSYEYLILWDRIARENPNTRFYTYTKRLDLIERFEKEYHRTPAFILQLSTWAGIVELKDLIARQLEKYPRFEYDDNTRPELKAVKHCPAVDANGKRTGITCAQCGHCSRAKFGDIWAVYAH